MRRRGTLEEWRAHVFKARGLSYQARLLLIMLADHMNANLEVSVPRETLAQRLGCHERRIDDWLSEACGKKRGGIGPDQRLLDHVVHGRKGVTAVYQGLVPDKAQRDVRPRAKKESNLDLSALPPSALRVVGNSALKTPDQAFSARRGVAPDVEMRPETDPRPGAQGRDDGPDGRDARKRAPTPSESAPIASQKRKTRPAAAGARRASPDDVHDMWERVVECIEGSYADEQKVAMEFARVLLLTPKIGNPLKVIAKALGDVATLDESKQGHALLKALRRIAKGSQYLPVEFCDSCEAPIFARHQEWCPHRQPSWKTDETSTIGVEHG